MATKKDLVDRILKKLDFLQPEDAKIATDCLFDCISESLLQEDRVEIRGFGSLSIRKRKFPKSNKEYKTIYYRASKNMHQLLND